MSFSPEGEECSDKPIKRQNTEKVNAVVKHANEIQTVKIKEEIVVIAVFRTKAFKEGLRYWGKSLNT